MSGISLGEYLSAMRHHKEELIGRFEDFWREISTKARLARVYQGHVIVKDAPEFTISLDGTGLTLLTRNRIVFLEKAPLLEIEFYKKNEKKDVSILKVYISTEGALYLGHPSDVESLDFFHTEIGSDFFEAIIRSVTAGKIISIDR